MAGHRTLSRLQTQSNIYKHLVFRDFWSLKTRVKRLTSFFKELAMAIVKLERKNNPFQVKVKDSEGKWITRVFATIKDADEFEGKLRSQKRSGTLLTNADRQLTVSQYFETWMEAVQHHASRITRMEDCSEATVS